MFEKNVLEMSVKTTTHDGIVWERIYVQIFCSAMRDHCLVCMRKKDSGCYVLPDPSGGNTDSDLDVQYYCSTHNISHRIQLNGSQRLWIFEQEKIKKTLSDEEEEEEEQEVESKSSAQNASSPASSNNSNNNTPQ